MEIGPVPGIRALGAVRTRRVEWQSPAVFDIDGSAKPGDGIVQTSAKKAGGAEEDGVDEFAAEEGRGEDETRRSVDYFA